MKGTAFQMSCLARSAFHNPTLILCCKVASGVTRDQASLKGDKWDGIKTDLTNMVLHTNENENLCLLQFSRFPSFWPVKKNVFSLFSASGTKE